jgi:hypothetical protein
MNSGKAVSPIDITCVEWGLAGGVFSGIVQDVYTSHGNHISPNYPKGRFNE